MSDELAYAIGGLGVGFIAGVLCTVAWAASVVARILGEHPVQLLRWWWEEKRGR